MPIVHYTSSTGEKRRERFLAALAETASVTKACQLAHLPRISAYQWRRSYPDFAAAWEAALDLGNETLEDEAVRRAVEGTEKPVYQQGRLVGLVQEYSDTLLIFLLKGRRPEKYGEKLRQEISGPGGDAVQIDDRGASAARIAAILEAAQGRPL